MTDESNTKIIDGAYTAIELLDDGVLQGVLLLGIYTDGSGAKIWSTGNEKVNDLLRAKLLSAIPLPPRRPFVEDDDGA